MADTDIELLARAHDLFRGEPPPASLAPPSAAIAAPTSHWAGDLAGSYRSAFGMRDADLTDSLHTDAEATRLLGSAWQGHGQGFRDTAAVLAAARVDDPRVDNRIAMRELMRRRLARLRAQRAHVHAAHGRARHARHALRGLRYAVRHRAAAADPRARRAVRAALSRLGCPYVWGATGPDRFDCSGLVKWAYAQAGIPLHRTTFEQINDGMPVARSQVRPGDLVFPHTGHVQMAIGHDLVIEAPQPGSRVQISRLGEYIAIRRP